MADEQPVGELAPEGERPGVADTPDVAAHPEPVHATVTYSYADARATTLLILPGRLMQLLGVVAAFTFVVTLVANPAKPSSWLPAAGYALLLVAIFMVWLPWGALRNAMPNQEWTVTAQGVHITIAGTDVTHDWSRFDEIVIRPPLIQFRIRRCNLTLPRRYVDDASVAAIIAMASAAGVKTRQGGRLG